MSDDLFGVLKLGGTGLLSGAALDNLPLDEFQNLRWVLSQNTVAPHFTTPGGVFVYTRHYLICPVTNSRVAVMARVDGSVVYMPTVDFNENQQLRVRNKLMAGILALQTQYNPPAAAAAIAVLQYPGPPVTFGTSPYFTKQLLMQVLMVTVVVAVSVAGYAAVDRLNNNMSIGLNTLHGRDIDFKTSMQDVVKAQNKLAEQLNNAAKEIKNNTDDIKHMDERVAAIEQLIRSVNATKVVRTIQPVFNTTASGMVVWVNQTDSGFMPSLGQIGVTIVMVVFVIPCVCGCLARLMQ